MILELVTHSPVETCTEFTDSVFFGWARGIRTNYSHARPSPVGAAPWPPTCRHRGRERPFLHIVLPGHDQAAAVRAEIPDADGLKADIAALAAWVGAIRRRRSN